MRPATNLRLNWLLKEAGLPAGVLAQRIFSSRPHVVQVLNGKRAGEHTRARIVDVVKREGGKWSGMVLAEFEKMEWAGCSTGNVSGETKTMGDGQLIKNEKSIVSDF